MILRLNNQVGLENIAVCAFVGETLELNCTTDDNMVPLEITAPDGSMATGSLIVSSVDIGDEGTYSCRLSNDPGPCGLSTEQREVRVFSYCKCNATKGLNTYLKQINSLVTTIYYHHPHLHSYSLIFATHSC